MQQATSDEAAVLIGDLPWFWCGVPGRPSRGSAPGCAAADGRTLDFRQVFAGGDGGSGEGLGSLVGGQPEVTVSLHTVATALGDEVNDEMVGRPLEALFTEAARLLGSILSFSCEGVASPLMRSRAFAGAMRSSQWRTMVPQVLIGQWFDTPFLVEQVFAGSALRSAVEMARGGLRAQFITFLARAAALEVMPPRGRPGQLRYQWSSVLALYPEVAAWRALIRHVRGRCWEDVRDRSRSRSRSRNRKKEKAEKPSQGQGASVPPGAVRFFVKGCGGVEDVQLDCYFSYFGKVLECSVLRDKKTKRSRGMAFVTLRPEGSYRGKRNTPDMLRSWVLEQSSHHVGGQTLEVTEAEKKPVEDEERKREERVEERRKQREEKEQRHGRDAAAERVVLSPWAKRWRREMVDVLPQDAAGAASWSDPRVRTLSCALWREAAEYAARTGDQEVAAALDLCRAPAPSNSAAKAAEWSFVPGADMLMLVGEGLVGLTSEGVFIATAARDPLPPGVCEQYALVPAAPMPMLPQQGNAGGVLSLTHQQQLQQQGYGASSRRWERGNNDEEKIFVGGLHQTTTTEVLTAYFSSYGNIIDAVVMMDKVTNKTRGFGFVVFDNMASVEAVINDYTKHFINGKWVDVKRATPQGSQDFPAGVWPPLATCLGGMGDARLGGCPGHAQGGFGAAGAAAALGVPPLAGPLGCGAPAGLWPTAAPPPDVGAMSAAAAGLTVGGNANPYERMRTFTEKGPDEPARTFTEKEPGEPADNRRYDPLA